MILIYILTAIIGLAGLLFLIYAIRYNRKLGPVKKAFEKLSSDEKMKVLHLISAQTEIPPTGALLVPVGSTDEPQHIITVPKELNCPWKGKAFSIIFKKDREDSDIEIKISSSQNDFSVLGNTKFIPVLVPRVVSKNGKETNTWSPRNLLARNKELKILVKSFIKERYVDLLASILENKPVLADYHEPLFQIRIGDGLRSIDRPEYVHCDICKKKMKYIFNFPGSYTGKKGYTDLIYYVFGCKIHPDHVKYTLQAF